MGGPVLPLSLVRVGAPDKTPARPVEGSASGSAPAAPAPSLKPMAHPLRR